MKMTLDLVKKAIGEFAVIFPVPEAVHQGWDADRFFQIWLVALEDFEKDEVHSACRSLIKKIKYFPYPADVVDEIRAAQARLAMPGETAVD